MKRHRAVRVIVIIVCGLLVSGGLFAWQQARRAAAVSAARAEEEYAGPDACTLFPQSAIAPALPGHLTLGVGVAAVITEHGTVEIEEYERHPRRFETEVLEFDVVTGSQCTMPLSSIDGATSELVVAVGRNMHPTAMDIAVVGDIDPEITTHDDLREGGLGWVKKGRLAGRDLCAVSWGPFSRVDHEVTVIMPGSSCAVAWDIAGVLAAELDEWLAAERA